MGLAVLAGEGVRRQVDADRLARGELGEGVPDAAAEVQHAPVRQQRRAQPIGRDVALVGGVEAALVGDDALAGDHGVYFLDFQIPRRCSTSRIAAHRVLVPYTTPWRTSTLDASSA